MSNILDQHVATMPRLENGFDIFVGEWASTVPGLGLGASPLFTDHRILWLEQQAAGFYGKRILELGPLEGGHTYMMSSRGAAHITAVESNSRAYLKCLILSNYLRMNAQFVLGDFRLLLSKRQCKFDFVLASGVLYHMTDPVSLLEDICIATDSIGLWTHYYSEDTTRRLGLESTFSGDAFETSFRDLTIRARTHIYGAALDFQGFTGGTAPTSVWLSKEGILQVLHACGFDCTVGADEPDNAAGACMLVYAQRRKG